MAQNLKTSGMEGGKLHCSTEVTLNIDRATFSSELFSNLDFLDKVRVREIKYWSKGVLVAGYLFEPRQAGQYPAVIYNRGGYGAFGMIAPNLDLLQLVELASEGYVIAASQYRGTANGAGHDEFGGEDINDVLSLIPVLDEFDNVDSAQIGMFGHSRGGVMTYLALAATDRIKAAIIMAGPTDLEAALAHRPEMMRVYIKAMGGCGRNISKELEKRSAINLVDLLPDNAPILIIHGTADWRVPPSDSLNIAAKMLECRKPFRLLMLEGADHALSEHQDVVQENIRRWLKLYLGNQRTLPNLVPHGH